MAIIFILQTARKADPISCQPSVPCSYFQPRLDQSHTYTTMLIFLFVFYLDKFADLLYILKLLSILYHFIYPVTVIVTAKHNKRIYIYQVTTIHFGPILLRTTIDTVYYVATLSIVYLFMFIRPIIHPQTLHQI